EEKGKATIGFKLEMEHAAILVENDPRFERAPYVGHKGWVSLDAKSVKDWNEVRGLVMESYRLIAPKKTLAKLDAVPSAQASTRNARTKSAQTARTPH